MDESELLMLQLQKLAAEDGIGKKSDPRYSVYVIEVEKIDSKLEYDFYVGSTGNPVRYRFAQHVPNHKFAARIFRNSRAKALCIRWDMTFGFPKFHTKSAAEMAESWLASLIQESGWNVCSDQLRKY
jgi:hypothetical protein